MWCNQCQQDVPALASADRREFCCPRCSNELQARSGGMPGVDESVAYRADRGKAQTAPPPHDAWESEQQLRHIAHVIGAKKVDRPEPPADSRPTVARIDSAHGIGAGMHSRPSDQDVGHDGAEHSAGPMAALTWLALSLGTMAFVCGGILTGWSIVTSRADLWTIGLPVALGGQIALLIGLILQLDRLRQDNRQAADKLKHVDDKLLQIKTTTTMLGTGTQTPGGAFYAHLANGAGPDLLLSDLKGQLDLLAMKISMHDG